MITTQFPGVLTRPVWGWEAGSEAVDQDRTRGRSARSFPVRYDLSWGSGERMTTRRASRISDQRSLSPTRAFFLSTSDHQEHHFNDTMIHARHQNICHPFPWNLGGKKHHQMHCWSNLKSGKWKRVQGKVFQLFCEECAAAMHFAKKSSMQCSSTATQPSPPVLLQQWERQPCLKHFSVL